MTTTLVTESDRPTATVSIQRGRDYWQATCSCGWTGVLRSTRHVESYRLAERDASEHRWAHEHGDGWFDYMRGWVENPTRCACHYTTSNGLRALVEATS